MTEKPGIAPGGEPTSFEECLQRVNPSQASLENLALQTDSTPIIMLNLLRYRPRGDSHIYSLYGREAAPEIKKVGSFVSFFGTNINDLDPTLGFDNSWDGVVLPVYQRRRSFLDLQKSSRYQLAIPYRSAGTSRRTLYALSDCNPASDIASTNINTLSKTRSGLSFSEDEICSIELLKFDPDSSSPSIQPYNGSESRSEIILSVRAEVPILSEQYWDHCIIRKFRSRSDLEDFYRQLPSSFASSLRIACRSILLP